MTKTQFYAKLPRYLSITPSDYFGFNPAKIRTISQFSRITCANNAGPTSETGICPRRIIMSHVSNLPPAILVNFHIGSEWLRKQLRLKAEDLTQEEWEARQVAREEQNTHVRAHMVDTGEAILNGQSGATGLMIANFIRDVRQVGYHLNDAYIVAKYQKRTNADGMVNTVQVGHVARFIFSLSGEVKFEDPSDSIDLTEDLIEELEHMNAAPLIIVWRNKNPAGMMTTDTVNIVALSRNDERAGADEAPRDLRFKDGEYRILSYNKMVGYFPLE